MSKSWSHPCAPAPLYSGIVFGRRVRRKNRRPYSADGSQCGEAYRAGFGAVVCTTRLSGAGHRHCLNTRRSQNGSEVGVFPLSGFGKPSLLRTHRLPTGCTVRYPGPCRYSSRQSDGHRTAGRQLLPYVEPSVTRRNLEFAIGDVSEKSAGWKISWSS